MENYDGLTRDMWKKFVPGLIFFAMLVGVHREDGHPDRVPYPANAGGLNTRSKDHLQTRRRA